MVDATLSEHGPVKGGMSCRGMNRLALVHQGDGRHPRVATVARQICERATVAPGGWLRISARASIKKVGPPQLSDRGAPTLKKRKTLDTTYGATRVPGTFLISGRKRLEVRASPVGTTRTQAYPMARPLSARADISAQTARSGGDPNRTKAGSKCRTAARLCCPPICYALTLGWGQRMQFTQLNRREFITLLGGAAVWPLAARAQQPERMRRIGVLMNLAAADPDAQANVAVFLKALQQLGWIDGRNVQVEYRWGAGS